MAPLASAAFAQQATIPRVSYGSTGWKYAIVSWNQWPSFADPAFDDSAWSTATAPWGWGCLIPQTNWNPVTDLLVRRTVDVPPNGRIRVGAKIDNDLMAFVQGVALTPMTVYEGCVADERYSATSGPLPGGPVVVAIRARDRGGATYLDARIEVVFSADCNGDGIIDYGQCRDGSLPDYDGNNIPDCCEAGTPCTVDHYPVQWRVEEGGNGHWYQWIGSSVTRDAARATAVSSGGDLASIASAAENDFIKIVVQGVNAWIGGYQAAGSCEPGCGWRWLDGSEWSYSNWDPESGEPNDGGGGQTGEQGLEFRSTGRWNDYWTWRELPYVNEWSADCDADGVVDYGQIHRGEVADVNGNGIPDTCDCPADINQSGTIDAEDLAYVLFAWGMPGGKAGGADINGDAIVDANDLSLVLGSWGPCPN